jgi:hypothetical protein
MSPSEHAERFFEGIRGNLHEFCPMTAPRYYPDAEGYTDKTGKQYPNLPGNQIRPELQQFVQTLQQVCHENDVSLTITSANHGVHGGEDGISMHYMGLALDLNLYPIDPKTKRTSRVPLDFEPQGKIVAQACVRSGFDSWIWVDDLGTHTHVSIHP